MAGNDFAIIDGDSPGHDKDGFFSYDMNLDLKRTTANYSASYPYPQMPKMAQLKKTADTVFMFDCAFSPNRLKAPVEASILTIPSIQPIAGAVLLPGIAREATFFLSKAMLNISSLL